MNFSSLNTELGLDLSQAHMTGCFLKYEKKQDAEWELLSNTSFSKGSKSSVFASRIFI